MSGSARRVGGPTSRRRSGFALVAALALLALSTALLAGALAIATAMARSVRSERATLEVEAHARHALASVLAEWGWEADSLAVGQWVERELSSSERGVATGGSLASGRLRIQRLAPALYAVVVDVRIGAAPSSARQRVRLLVTRPMIPVALDSTGRSTVDSASASPADTGRVLARVRGAPAPIPRWSAADLY
jgi:hypothetical protein